MATTTSETTTRRDFLYIATGAVGAIGAAAATWPLVAQMWPDASTVAMSTTEVDIGNIAEGQIVTVKWQGKPVFIRHLSAKEYAEATAVPLSDLPDKDPAHQKRVEKPQWLVAIGLCTHLGCVPNGHKGAFDGWFCPCHGSDYDTLGRIRSGPAPRNLDIPKYEFLSDTKIKIG